MNTEFALDFIPRRMKELGYGKNYITRWRHLQIDAAGILKIDAENEYYYLIQPGTLIAVKSKFGDYNVNDPGINEMQYEHKGKIEISNLHKEPQLVLFIQVIPKHHLK